MSRYGSCQVVLIAVILSLVLAWTGAECGEVEDFRFAEKLLSDGLYSAAGDEFLRFTRKYPESTLAPDAFFKAGEAYMQAGKAQEALGAFERFVSLFPNERRICKVHYYRGKILSALGRYSEAAGEFLNVPELDVADPLVDSSLLEAGKSLMSGGNFGEASRVLRRLIYERKRSEVTPEAIYIYSSVLDRLGRKLEAKEVLEELIDTYPSSPVAAFALMRLAEKAVEALDYEAARGYYERVLSRYREKAIRERAASALLEIARDTNDLHGLVELSASFLKEHRGSKRAGEVAAQAADAAFGLGLYGKVVDFVRSMRSAEPRYPDSLGHYALLMAESYYRMGNVAKSLDEIGTVEKNPSASDEARRRALVLKADIMAEEGEGSEALRLYNTALLFSPPLDERLSVLEKSSALALTSCRDTLLALNYLDMIEEADAGGGKGEEALWRASRLRERLGLFSEAERGYRRLVEAYPLGRHFGEAEERLEVVKAVPRVDVKALRKLASYVARLGENAETFLDVGLVMLKEARDVEGAISYLEKAYRSVSVDSLRAKAAYHLAEAKYELSKVVENEKRRSSLAGDAATLWREVARKYVGTRWGELSHRRYMEAVSSGWSVGEKLSRYDEYMRYYGGGEGRWWALAGKLEVLYGEAAGEGRQYADSALSVCREILSDGKAPGKYRREARLKLGYLLRMKGDHAGAVRAMEEFRKRHPDDPRSSYLLYDLGEELIRVKDYEGAGKAFSDCIAASPGGRIVERCRLRIGDCLYYRRLFERARESYVDFLERYPSSSMRDEVSFRLVLVAEMMGQRERALSMLGNLYRKGSLNRSLRRRVLRRYAKLLVEKGKYDKALNVLRELSSSRRDSESLTLLGEASLGAKRYGEAIKSFDGALRTEGVDSCRVLSGKVAALAGLKRFGDAGRTAGEVMNLCPVGDRAPRVLLKLGAAEMEADRIEQARKRFETLKEKYGDFPQADEAIYYLAVCDIKQGGYKEAIDKLEHFIKVAPDSPLIPGAYLKLASANYMLKNRNLAAKYYSFAVESARDREIRYMALSNLGRVLQELEEWEKAADVWKDLAEQYPGKPDVVETLFNLGFCYGRTQKFELAYEVYSRIPDLTFDQEQEGRAHYWAGVSLKNMERYREAAMEFLRVPYLKTGGMWGVTSKLEAASCYEKTGEYEEAKKLYGEVIQRHGLNSNWGKLAKKALERLSSTAPPLEDKSGGKNERER